MRKQIMAIGFAVALVTGANPAYAQTVETVLTCQSLAKRMRTDFIAYRASRGTEQPTGRGPSASRTSAVLRVGITIVPRGSARAWKPTAMAFQTFRRQQFRIISQMRRIGCV